MAVKLDVCRNAGKCFVCLHDTWTAGAKKLRALGFTIYPKEHKAFIGRITKDGIFQGSIEITHDREKKTQAWNFDFHIDFGKHDFLVSLDKKFNKCSVQGLQVDFDDFKRDFQDKYSAEMKIIKNIFFNNQD